MTVRSVAFINEERLYERLQGSMVYAKQAEQIIQVDADQKEPAFMLLFF
jgi:hypothetical protein